MVATGPVGKTTTGRDASNRWHHMGLSPTIRCTESTPQNKPILPESPQPVGWILSTKTTGRDASNRLAARGPKFRCDS